MGCRSSKSADAGTISRWRSTGIVALRDSKLKAFPFILRTFPDEVFDLERSVRTLDLTHNKMGIVLQLLELLICLLITSEYKDKFY
ncbi:hypothetical protein MTR67_015125 [Solanum verrucosum]|uniref:Uncharacterized protein n=1 Tax=Solanum verrucosum TaxID=315347 RepID=A0AAF0QGA5_SOLVR|nr:hypothetical protein MTR67_015125 [Solanum verrucosum]